jgi:hypothetical protein
LSLVAFAALTGFLCNSESNHAMYHGINEAQSFEPVGIVIKGIFDCVEERLDRMRQRQAA